MDEMTPRDRQYFEEQGFIAGPLPAEYQRFFGADPSVQGYRIVTNPNGTTNVVVARPQGDADGGLQFQQFGNTLARNSQGILTPGADPVATPAQRPTPPPRTPAPPPPPPAPAPVAPVNLYSSLISTPTQPTPIPPTPTPTPSPTPPRPPAKTAPIDTVLFDDDSISPETMIDLVFEDIGGHELLSISRNDIINGQPVSYSPIKNLGLVQQRYNPNNILGLQSTSDKYFANFAIKFDEKVPLQGSGADGLNVYIEEATGDLIIEAVNMNNDEQLEVQVAVNGTIYEANFGEITS